MQRLCRPTPQVGDAVEVRANRAGAGSATWRAGMVTRVYNGARPQVDVEYQSGRVEPRVELDRVLLMLDRTAQQGVDGGAEKRGSVTPRGSRVDFLSDARWRSSSYSFAPVDPTDREKQEQAVEARWIAGVLAQRCKVRIGADQLHWDIPLVFWPTDRAGTCRGEHSTSVSAGDPSGRPHDQSEPAGN